MPKYIFRQREEARSAPDAAAKAQYLEDERLALMMQNEEFMAELRGDREFMTALQQEQAEAAVSVTDGSSGGGAAGGGGGGGGGGRLQDYSTGVSGKNMMDEALFRFGIKKFLLILTGFCVCQFVISLTGSVAECRSLLIL
jgi:hypothetical protein